MILHEEIYFDITLEGDISALKKFENYALSGVFDDFFEVDEDYLIYDEDNTGGMGRLIFTNDDMGIEISRVNTEDFLELLCRGAIELDVRGNLYDVEDEEFRFLSPAGDSDFSDADAITIFNDELDATAREEEVDEDDEGEDE